MSSPIVFFQIASPDPEASRAFYQEVFGWSFGEPGPDGRISIDLQGPGDFDPSGSLIELGADGGQPVTMFFRVSDLWATVERAEGLGAEVVLPIMQIPAGPHLAIIRDPDATVVGIIQA